MKNKLRERLKNIAHGKLEPAAKLIFDIISWLNVFISNADTVWKIKEICLRKI